MTDRTDEQQTLPGVPRPIKLIRVNVHPNTQLLQVDAEEWDRMSQAERDEYVYEAGIELGWYLMDFAEYHRG